MMRSRCVAEETETLERPPRPEKAKAAPTGPRNGFQKVKETGKASGKNSYPKTRVSTRRDTVIEAGRLDIVEVATHFRGKPNRFRSFAKEVRWGERGRFAVWLTGPFAFRWYDFGDEEGGDTFDLIQAETGLGFADAVDWYGETFMGEHPDRIVPARRFTRAEPKLRTKDDDEEHRRKVERARTIWREAIPIAGTYADDYLQCRLRTRQIPDDVLRNPSFRFHPAPYYGAEEVEGSDGALIALMRDPVTGDGTGIHRTFVSATCRRLEKRMLGKRGAVMLTPFEDVSHGLAICEGIETGLAVRQNFGWGTIWCSLSAGALGVFPVIGGVECLTIFADNDLPDRKGRQAGQSAAMRCAERWQEAGRSVEIITPTRGGADFADAVAA